MSNIKRFYCMGVPRSGTTYFANLMNSHKNILCGMECFPPGNLKGEWLSKEDFSSKAARKDAEIHWTAQLSKKNNQQGIGDKFPRAYFSYKKVLSELSGGAIFINIRNMKDVFHSFDARANNKEDSWRAGMVWFFAYAEFLHLLSIASTSSSDNVYLVNYDYLMGMETRNDAATEILNSIDMRVTENVNEFLEKSQSRTILSIEKERPQDPLQNKILALNHMQEYQTLFKFAKITPIKELSDEIKRISDLAFVEIQDNREIYSGVISQLCKNNEDFIKVWNDTMLPKYLNAFESEHLKLLLEIVNDSIKFTNTK